MSHRKNFIFLKPRKVAGTSIEIYLEPYCRDDGVTPTHSSPQQIGEAGIVGARMLTQKDHKSFMFKNHMSASDLLSIVGRDVWSTYRKITCVRNPFDKVVSAFWWDQPQTDRAENKAVAAFREYVRTSSLRDDRKIYTLDGALCCDAHIRYESLNSDLEAVCSQLKIPFEPERLGDYKSGFRPRTIPLAAYYDEESTAKVLEFFAPEFKWFGYLNTPPTSGE